jgi:hypothetical protein
MTYTIKDYEIERERNQDRWYHLTIYDSNNSIHDFSVEAKARITIDKGKITSINGNGLKRSDFRKAIIKLHAYRSFDAQIQENSLKALEDLVCKDK